jgi:transcriptional regulator with XRE-family HTH domain
MCNLLCMSTQQTEHHVPVFDLADRMRKALREAEVGVQEMADYLDVGRNTVSTWINGRVTPSTQTQRLWAMRCGVPLRWLQTGETGDPEEGLGKSGEDVRHQGLEPRTRWFGGFVTSSARVVLFPQRDPAAPLRRSA